MNWLLDLLPILGSLIMIVLILLFTYWATRWYARRMGPSLSGRNIRIVDRAALSNSASLVIARVCGKYYLLGVGEKGVTLLRELEDFEEQPAAASSQLDFAKLLGRLMAKPGKTGGDGEDKAGGGPQ